MLNIEGEGKQQGRRHGGCTHGGAGQRHPLEARVQATKGCYVVEGDAVAKMYDLLLGKDLLEPLAGHVDPLLQQYVYFPRLAQGEPTQHTLPIQSWVPKRVPAAAAVPPSVACVGWGGAASDYAAGSFLADLFCSRCSHLQHSAKSRMCTLLDRQAPPCMSGDVRLLTQGPPQGPGPGPLGLQAAHKVMTQHSQHAKRICHESLAVVNPALPCFALCCTAW